MNQPQDPRKTLQDIKNLMERSSRFISLSGLSGVAAGIWALLGAAAIFKYLGLMPFTHKYIYYQYAINNEKWGFDVFSFFLIVGAVILIGATLSAWFFTNRKAKRAGVPVWDKTTRQMLIHLSIPLVAGGLFCFALLRNGSFGLIAPATLIFYGLALVNASKYTFQDVRYLGLTEVGLGLLAAFIPGFGLEFWAVGFGILHIIYGTTMYYKYEQSA